MAEKRRRPSSKSRGSLLALLRFFPRTGTVRNTSSDWTHISRKATNRVYRTVAGDFRTSGDRWDLNAWSSQQTIGNMEETSYFMCSSSIQCPESLHLRHSLRFEWPSNSPHAEKKLFRYSSQQFLPPSWTRATQAQVNICWTVAPFKYMPRCSNSGLNGLTKDAGQELDAVGLPLQGK